MELQSHVQPDYPTDDHFVHTSMHGLNSSLSPHHPFSPYFFVVSCQCPSCHCLSPQLGGALARVSIAVGASSLHNRRAYFVARTLQGRTGCTRGHPLQRKCQRCGLHLKQDQCLQCRLHLLQWECVHSSPARVTREVAAFSSARLLSSFDAATRCVCSRPHEACISFPR